MDYATLQSNAKRDPDACEADVAQHVRHYGVLRALVAQHPDDAERAESFAELCQFLAQMTPLYPALLGDFAADLSALLDQQAAALRPALRMQLVKALLLLRNRNCVLPTDVLPLLFRLLRVRDKPLRQLVHSHLVADITRCNRERRDDRLNRQLQNFMFTMLQDDNAMASTRSLQVVSDLYRRHVWRDTKTVNVIASTCFAKGRPVKMWVQALQFFLQDDRKLRETTGGADNNDDDFDDDSDLEDSSKQTDDANTPIMTPMDERARMEAIEHARERLRKLRNSRVKKSRKYVKQLAAAEVALKKAHRLRNKALPRRGKSSGVDVAVQANLSAIQLLHDPQTLAERLFALLRSTTERFEVKLLLVSLISRLIAVHELQVLNFYPYLHKYLQPHHRDVAVILANLAQSCHKMVPPDAIQPTLMVLVNNFVHDRAAPEIQTVGLNTVREMCSRCPLIMDEALLADLIQYRKARNKGVQMAARSLLHLYRNVYPELLHRKERGREASINPNAKPEPFASQHVSSGVAGIELLEAAERRGMEAVERDLMGDSDSEFDSDDDSDDDSEGEGEGADGSVAGGGNDSSGYVDNDDNDNDGDDDNDDDDDDDSDDDAGAEDAPPQRKLDQVRLLTQEDFKKLRYLKELHAQAVEDATMGGSKKARKRAAAIAAESLEQVSVAPDSGELVGVDELTRFVKRRRTNKEERVAGVMAGREGREFGSKMRHRDHASTTNTEKLKSKPMAMSIYKRGDGARAKTKMSFRAKQRMRQAHLKKQKLRKLTGGKKK